MRGLWQRSRRASCVGWCVALLLGVAAAPRSWAMPLPKIVVPLDTAGRGYLGVLFKEETSLTIRETIPDGPAALAGLLAEDTIIRVGGIAMEQRVEVQLFLGERRPGTFVEIVVNRAGERKTLILHLGNMTPEVESNYRLLRQRELEPAAP